jgi:hypothetical protein
LLTVLPLRAQSPRREIFGAVGVGFASDDEGSIGHGVNGGGGIGYRLTRRFGVEAEVNAFRARRSFGQPIPPFGADGAHLTANALVHFGGQRAQFYLVGGAGLLHARNLAGVSANGFAIDVGGGLKLYATPHVFIRPDLRIFAGDAARAIEPPLSDLRVSIGIGYAW